MNSPITKRPLTRHDLERMHIPEEFWRAKLNLVPSSVHATISRYVSRIPEMVRRPAGLILHGGTGVGKTSIASIVLKEARSLGFTGFFVGVWELREFIRARVMFDETSSILDRCRDVDVLVLDNLMPTDVNDSPLNSRALEEIVSMRSSRKKATIVTTSMTSKEFSTNFKSFCDTTKSSLVPIVVTGADLRMAAMDALSNDIIVKPSK